MKHDMRGGAEVGYIPCFWAWAPVPEELAGGEHGRRYEIGEIGRLAASSGPEAALGAWSTCGWWCPATLGPGGAVNICARGRSVTLNVLVRFRKSARFREIVSPYISIVMS